MSVKGRKVVVGTEVVVLAATELQIPKTVTILNNSDTTVYIGGANVSTSDGFPLKAGASQSVDLDGDDAVYGICTLADKDVRVFETSIQG